jgi:hypothetical protein
LNDRVFRDFDLVTALTHFHKQLLKQELQAVLNGERYDFYSDFKSIRLTLYEPAKTKAVSEAFERANARFYHSPVLSQIIRESDLREPWFHMGIGQSADQAALAARYARVDGGERNIRHYDDARVQSALQSQLGEVHSLHEQLIRRLWNSGLVDRRSSELRLSVFMEARKAKSPKALLEALQQRFPEARLTLSSARLILRFIQACDRFSPNMLIEKREILSIDEAPFGAIALDFLGLGAENGKATAHALVKARDLNEALMQAREGERHVTRVFNERKMKIRRRIEKFFDGAVTVRFSGDDGLVIPQREFSLGDQLVLLHELGKLFSEPKFRMSVIGAKGVGNGQASGLITHGEGLEKKLRALVQKDLGVPFANSMSVNVLNPGPGASLRDVYLLVSLRRRPTLEQRGHLRSIFSQAVDRLNQDMRQAGESVHYSPLEAFLIIN